MLVAYTDGSKAGYWTNRVNLLNAYFWVEMKCKNNIPGSCNEDFESVSVAEIRRNEITLQFNKLNRLALSDVKKTYRSTTCSSSTSRNNDSFIPKLFSILSIRYFHPIIWYWKHLSLLSCRNEGHIRLLMYTAMDGNAPSL